MFGFYADSVGLPTTILKLRRIGARIQASLRVEISNGESGSGKEILFNEVSYNRENGVIEMFKDGKDDKKSYYFSGVIRDRSLQGQLANSLGRVLDLELRLTKSD